MRDLTTINDLTTDFPEGWSFLWSPEEAKAIPNEHKDQIHFLNKEGTNMVNDILSLSKMLKGKPEDNPFNPEYFQTVEPFYGSESEIKKWLYNQGIPFDKYVFVDCDRSGQAVMLTWKMVIKYCTGLFFADDIVVFDRTLNWALFYWHEEKFYFAKDVIFDRDGEAEKTIEAIKILKKITAPTKN